MTEIICIVCPKGCHMKIEEDTMKVTGASCEKGIEYAEEEIRAPKRMLTSTVRVTESDVRRCPVRTRAPIPKEKIWDVMHEIDCMCISAPVRTGDAIIENAAGTGVDIIATRNLKKK